MSRVDTPQRHDMGERATELPMAFRENDTRRVFSVTFGWMEEFSRADLELFSLNQLSFFKKKTKFILHVIEKCNV